MYNVVHQHVQCGAPLFRVLNHSWHLRFLSGVPIRVRVGVRVRSWRGSSREFRFLCLMCPSMAQTDALLMWPCGSGSLNHHDAMQCGSGSLNQDEFMKLVLNLGECSLAMHGLFMA